MPRSSTSALATVFLMTVLLRPSSQQCLGKNDSAMKISEKARLDLLQSQLQFSVDLLQSVGDLHNTENVFFSPSSVYNALLLAYFVSANQTEKHLKKTLHLQEEQDKLNTLGAFSLEKYYQQMRSIRGSTNYQLSNANRMFVSDKEKVKPCIMKLFKEEIEKADFSKNVSSSVEKINKWVSEQTRGKITDLLSPDSLNQNTNLVLVNAAYFRGFWTHQFAPSETKEVDFILANGTKVSVMMMSQDNKFNHHIEEKLGAEVLELPYTGEDISMFILLPLKPSPTAVAELLNKTDIQTLLELSNSTSSEISEVSISIPKFSIDQTLELTPILESLGVGDLFQSSADLSTLTGRPGLKLDAVVHKAKLAVDEVGTEAAAATAIFANRFAADSFIANHPFVYFLIDKKTNILLFAGIFNAPET